MESLASLRKEIEEIKKRNARVEEGKAWEISRVRRLIVALFTYLSMSLYLKVVGISDPWLNGIVPTVGFLFSTLTLPFFRRVWQKYLNSRKRDQHLG